MVRGDHDETLAICRSLALARAAFKGAVEKNLIRSRIRISRGQLVSRARQHSRS